MSDFLDRFRQSLETGFIDKDRGSELLYQPKLLVNSKAPKRKVLSSLLWEFQTCESFFISVAFVTTGGVATIINVLQDLEEQNVKGKIVVSQYLNFTEPEALRRLLKFKNIELRIATNTNAHSKGYLFKKKNHYNLIVGSSNLTQTALSTNKEWNLQVSAITDSEIVYSVYKEFCNDFDSAERVTEDFIVEYEKEYQRKRILTTQFEEEFEEQLIIRPNRMQVNALKKLSNLRKCNKYKALIISATGTGKTYLSAFDALTLNPGKLLFVVHRLNIAKKAMSTFKKVFGRSRTMGVYSGNRREVEKDFLFSTVQTISKEHHLKVFNKDHFDYVIIDESHRSGAQSYRTLLKYFEPKFLLGMTATPERTDGENIFQLFDYNIAYEIRLNHAMEEQMLCPFHYYGVTDLFIDDEEQEDYEVFNRLTSDQRVERILEKSEFYGTDNGICRGLIFVSKVEEAKELSEKFNKRGYKTMALSGNNSVEERTIAIDRLESENDSERLDYLFTVDIFNEGIDIPKVNQIIMLRPTESAIIFVQQLGRGLRKHTSKSYLTVIDFIGNHNNNYLIPVALYGDNSYSKDRLRKLLSDGSTDLPGVSTINFDRVSKEKIFKSIDSANMSLLRDLRRDYSLMKYRLGRTPMMMDFFVSDSRDPYLFVTYSKSYYNFVVRVDDEFDHTLGAELCDLLGLYSSEINNGKRIEESFLLRDLCDSRAVSIESFKNGVREKYGYEFTDETVTSVLCNLNFEFLKKKKNLVMFEDGLIKRRQGFSEVIENEVFKNFLLDSIDYSISTFDSRFSLDKFYMGFILYQKYSRKDVCRLLNWKKDISSTLYGYRTKGGVTPCFVTYHKSDHIEDSINYNDHFISPTLFAWESRSNRKIESSEIQNVINSKRILLFIKKENSEGSDFYYMGDVAIKEGSVVQAVMPDSGQPVVHFKFELNTPVPESLYRYITDKNSDLQEQDSINSGSEQKLSTLQVGPQPSDEVVKIPFYDLYAAAGTFSELQTTKEYSMLNVPEKFYNDGCFAIRVIGESMNRRIPNGSICIFRRPVVGSRNGKILLVEYFNRQDQDLNSHFTVKTYSSYKVENEDGWQHAQIILRPNSFDTSYEDIVITEEDIRDNVFNVIGEFVSILEQ